MSIKTYAPILYRTRVQTGHVCGHPVGDCFPDFFAAASEMCLSSHQENTCRIDKCNVYLIGFKRNWLAWISVLFPGLEPQYGTWYNCNPALILETEI